MQSIEHFISELNESSKIDTCAATDCLGVTCKLEKQATVVSMLNKLHPIARDFFLLKYKIIKSISFVKVDDHQDDVKSFDKLSFLEKLHVQCDSRAKAFMLNVLEL